MREKDNLDLKKQIRSTHFKKIEDCDINSYKLKKNVYFQFSKQLSTFFPFFHLNRSK